MFSTLKEFFTRFGEVMWKLFDATRKILIFFGFMALGLMIFFHQSGGIPVHVADGTALSLSPAGSVVEYPEIAARERAFLNLIGRTPASTVLSDIIDTLDYAAHDDRISALAMNLDDLGPAGVAQLQEIADAMTRFREAGKTIYTYAFNYNQNTYFLASHADVIAMDPEGAVDVPGLASFNYYFAPALERIDVRVTAVRAGTFKSAVEPYTRATMSDEARADREAFLSDLWDTYTASVDQARGFDAGHTRSYGENMVDNFVAVGGDTAALALEQGMVDKLVTPHEFTELVAEQVGWKRRGHSFNAVNSDRYLAELRKISNRSELPFVAIVVAQGPIKAGQAPVTQAGGETLADAIRRARLSSRVKAIVIRVNSPGGSVVGSEQIRREVVAAREAGKPVVVSMSNVAASGGYWIASASDHIYAQTGTITGSIGAFGMIMTYEGALGRLGVTAQGVATTEAATFGRTDMDPTPEFIRMVQASIDNTYAEFTTLVSESRDIPLADISGVAEGRVWSGTDAMSIGLIDEFGGIRAAVGKAAELANLDAYRSGIWSLTPTWRSKYIAPLNAMARVAAEELGLVPTLPAPLDELAASPELMDALSWMNDPGHVYSYCGCDYVQ